MVFVDELPLFGVTLFYLIKEGLLKYSLYLQGGLYLDVAFNTGLIVFKMTIVEGKFVTFVNYFLKKLISVLL